MLKLFHIAGSEKDQRDVVKSKRSLLYLMEQTVQKRESVLFRHGNIFQAAGILKAEHHRGQTGISFINNRLREIFGSRHIHGRAKAVLQKLALCVLIEIDGVFDK